MGEPTLPAAKTGRLVRAVAAARGRLRGNVDNWLWGAAGDTAGTLSWWRESSLSLGDGATGARVAWRRDASGASSFRFAEAYGGDSDANLTIQATAQLSMERSEVWNATAAALGAAAAARPLGRRRRRRPTAAWRRWGGRLSTPRRRSPPAWRRRRPATAGEGDPSAGGARRVLRTRDRCARVVAAAGRRRRRGGGGGDDDDDGRAARRRRRRRRRRVRGGARGCARRWGRLRRVARASMATQTLAARPVVALAAPSRASFCAARAECVECVADGFCVYCCGRCVEARAPPARRIAGKAGRGGGRRGEATALQPRHVGLQLVAAAERTEGSAKPLTCARRTSRGGRGRGGGRQRRISRSGIFRLPGANLGSLAGSSWYTSEAPRALIAYQTYRYVGDRLLRPPQRLTNKRLR